MEEEDVIMEMTNQNMDLEERIQELEEEKIEHQASLELFESLVVHTVARNVEFSQKLFETVYQREALKLEIEALRQEKKALRVEKEVIQAYLEGEVDNRLQVERQRDKAIDRVHDLEVEVRGKNAKMDKMSYAFETAFGC